MSEYKSLLFTMVLMLLLISLLASCGAPTATSQSTTSSTSPKVTTSSALSSATTTPLSSAAVVKPQGDLVGALQTFGSENFLPWLDPNAAPIDDIVYDMLIYWEVVDRKFLPGLAESWDVSSDGLTLTYHLRKGVQFHDGWGEFTSADVKFNFEKQASPKSVGKTSQCRRIASMDTPDPYTLVVHFKDPYPTFWADLSLGNSPMCQGIVSKKYVETVGEEVASQKAIGTGPYKMVDSKSGEYFKLEALESHWRLVPEFKNFTLRLIPEISTIAAALKSKEIDFASLPIEQLPDLKTAGLGTEVSPVGGNSLLVRLGGMVIPEDKRYDPAYHNKDPWTDVRVRKAMAMSIDREAISKAIFAGYADPAAVPLYSADMKKYQYPFDQVTAKQLLKDAGYANGFTFNAISYTIPGIPETPRILEALTGYWQQIGLNPKITVIDYNTYLTKNSNTCKTAGGVSMDSFTPIADMLGRVEMSMMPNSVSVDYEDEGSYAIYRDNPKSTFEERNTLVTKLNEYYYENVGPIPVVRVGTAYVWNPDKILPFPHSDSSRPIYLEYIRHAQPLNTFRLFDVFPGR